MTKKSHSIIRRAVTNYLLDNEQKYAEMILIDSDDTIPRRLQNASESVFNNSSFFDIFLIIQIRIYEIARKSSFSRNHKRLSYYSTVEL